MTGKRGLTIGDLMLGALLVGGVLVVVKDRTLQASPVLPPYILETGLWRQDPTWWLCPAAVIGCATTLLLVAIGSRFAGGRTRAFLAGAAVGGWLLFGLAFGAGGYSWPAGSFLPIGWARGLGEPLARVLNGIPASEEIMPSCGWSERCQRACHVIDAASCLVLGSACGWLATALAGRGGSGAEVARRAVLSAWGPVALMAAAGLLTVESWGGRLEIVTPLATAMLGLLILASIAGVAGLSAGRRGLLVFAWASWGYVALAFCPAFAAWDESLPSTWACRRIALAAFPPELPGTHGPRTHSILAFTDLGHLATAWALGILAARAASCLRVVCPPAFDLANAHDNAPKGESCPS